MGIISSVKNVIKNTKRMNIHNFKKMSKVIIKKEIIETICDMCENPMAFETIEIQFGYGSKFDGEVKHFCSDKCLKKFVIQKIKKNGNI